MKKIAWVGLFSLLFFGGPALAQQAEEQKKSASPGGMMHNMMKEEQSGEGRVQGMGEGMMRMMKMMGQCAAMMEQCCSSDSGKPKETPKQ